MIPEAPFLFSIAGLSASLAGLAGMVAGLRRGSDLRPIDLYRLREIVEFAFANVLLVLGFMPLVTVVGDLASSLRIAAGGALVYSAVHILVLYGRSRRHALATGRAWVVGAAVIDLATMVFVAATLVTGAMPPFQALLLVFLARPMFAFLLVLAGFEVAADASSAK